MNISAAHLLIVDDEIKNRRLLEALLRPEGYRTVSVASGEEALAAIELQPPDLILLDVMMPGMDGYELARRLKADASTSNIPIIMVTAQIDRSARLAGLEAGAEEFLTKPIDRAELWLRVRNLLRLKSFGDFLQGRSCTLEQAARERSDEFNETESRFSGFMESSPMLAWVSDDQGRLLYTNKAWNEFMGMDPRLEANDSDAARERAAILGKLSVGERDSLASGAVVQKPVWIPEQGGRFRCWNSIRFPLRESSGQLVVGGIGIDITQQKAAELEALDANAGLEQKVIERTASLESARGKAEHDSRSHSDYIHALGGEMSLPLDDIVRLIAKLRLSILDGGQTEILDSASESAASLQALVDRVLSYSEEKPPA